MVRAGAPVAPFGQSSPAFSQYAVPATSRWTHGVSPTNSLRNSAAVMAPPHRSPMFFTSATVESIFSRYRFHKGSSQPGSPTASPAAITSRMRPRSFPMAPQMSSPSATMQAPVRVAMSRMATLTGACMVALGEDIWGAMGNDRGLIRDVIAAGDAVGEPGWELPLWKRYREKIDSTVADVKNIGDRWGGAITAALFLNEFVGDTPWVHLDVAGTAYWEKAGDYWPKGATGSPARTIVRYVLDQAERSRVARAKARDKAAAAKAAASEAATPAG